MELSKNETLLKVNTNYLILSMFQSCFENTISVHKRAIKKNDTNLQIKPFQSIEKMHITIAINCYVKFASTAKGCCTDRWSGSIYAKRNWLYPDPRTHRSSQKLARSRKSLLDY